MRKGDHPFSIWFYAGKVPASRLAQLLSIDRAVKEGWSASPSRVRCLSVLSSAVAG